MSAETIDEIAERIERTADRYRNARDFARENESRIAAEAVRASSDITRAREIVRAVEIGQKPAASHEEANLALAGRSPRRPWWKWWRSGQTDDS